MSKKLLAKPLSMHLFISKSISILINLFPVTSTILFKYDTIKPGVWKQAAEKVYGKK